MTEIKRMVSIYTDIHAYCSPFVIFRWSDLQSTFENAWTIDQSHSSTIDPSRFIVQLHGNRIRVGSDKVHISRHKHAKSIGEFKTGVTLNEQLAKTGDAHVAVNVVRPTGRKVETFRQPTADPIAFPKKRNLQSDVPVRQNRSPQPLLGKRRMVDYPRQIVAAVLVEDLTDHQPVVGCTPPLHGGVEVDAQVDEKRRQLELRVDVLEAVSIEYDIARRKDDDRVRPRTLVQRQVVSPNRIFGENIITKQHRLPLTPLGQADVCNIVSTIVGENISSNFVVHEHVQKELVLQKIIRIVQKKNVLLMLGERVIRDNADGVDQRRDLYRVLGVVFETVITDGEVRHIAIGNYLETREIFDR